MKYTAKITKRKRARGSTPVTVTNNEFGFKSLDLKQREKDLLASLTRAVTTLRERAEIDPSTHRIQFMDPGELATLQDILEHGKTPGRWQTPQKWAGAMEASTVDIDLRGRIVASLEGRHQTLVREADEALARTQRKTDAEGAQLLPTAFARMHAIIDGAVVAATRYLLLCRVAPVGMAHAKGRPLDPTTIADLGYQYLPALLAVGVGKLLDNEQFITHGPALTSSAMIGYLGLVQTEDLERFSESKRAMMKIQVRRAHILASMGLWMDVPVWETQFEQVTAVKGVAKRRQASPKAVDPHLPLPDDYVANMGRKSLWIIQGLGPNLLTIAENIVAIWKSTDGIPADSVRKVRVAALGKYLQDYVWRDSESIEFECPPFEIRLHQIGQKRSRGAEEFVPDADATADEIVDADDAEEAAAVAAALAEPVALLKWPPRSFSHIVGLMGVLQCAHIFVTAMSAAPRKMELLSFRRDCIVRARDDTPFARGRTFKLVERHEGELRDWVLPDIATDAIEQQARLASLMEQIGPQSTEDNEPVLSPEPGTHLWVQTGYGQSDRTKPLRLVTHALTAYARALGMSVMPGGQRIRTHRFRKTVARLAALALTDAPMILMQVFGHKSVEMTLYYILTDRDLQVEVEQVRRELKIMRGVTVVENMAAVAMAEAAQEVQDAIAKANGGLGPSPGSVPERLFGGYGGPAAPKLFGAVKERVINMHRTGKEWGASDSYETAYFLTEAGISFTMPRDGVFCTKAFTQPAACTGKRGRTDPGNCQSDCGHRLELAARRSQLDASLTKLVALYEEALEEGHGLLAAGLAKKICEGMLPFEDIREKWMHHTTVRALVVAAGRVPA
jgi:hypothetical protein